MVVDEWFFSLNQALNYFSVCVFFLTITVLAQDLLMRPSKLVWAYLDFGLLWNSTGYSEEGLQVSSKYHSFEQKTVCSVTHLQDKLCGIRWRKCPLPDACRRDRGWTGEYTASLCPPTTYQCCWVAWARPNPLSFFEFKCEAKSLKTMCL